MKKIFYIANIRLPTEKAHGIQIMKTCEAFAENGAEVVLIVPRRFNKIKTDPFDYYQVKRNFFIAWVSTIDLVPLGKIGFLLETAIFSECAAWYIRFHSFGKKGKVIYSRDVWPLLNVSLLGWKLFWEAHMGSQSFITRKLLGRLTGLVAITSGLKKLYAGLGMNENKILVSPDAVDLQKFDISISQEKARAQLGLPLDKKIVMYIGLLDEWKGYQTLLDASEILPDVAAVQIVIIGGTREQISTLEQKYKKVRFLGYREYGELPENQKAADLLVIPNSAKFPISKHFTSPLKLFAHMASGVPIIASDLPSIREIVEESEVVFCEPDDPVDLARIIEATLKDLALLDSTVKQKAIRAKEKVVDHTWDNRGKKILNFISERADADHIHD